MRKMIRGFKGDDEGIEVSQKQQNEDTVLEEARVEDTDIEWSGDENIVHSGDELPSDKESDGEGRKNTFHVFNPFMVEKYLQVYEHAILPINGRKEWKKSDFVSPVPPNGVKKVGRPKKTRRLEPDEPVQKKKKRKPAPIFKEGSNKIKRQQTTVKYHKCGVQGHNARTCKEPITDVVTDAASQVMGRNEPVAEFENIPQKLKVRRKGKESVHKGVDVVIHRRTRSGVKIREPAPFVDGERQIQEKASSRSTPSIVKGGKIFITLSNLSEAVNEEKQKKDKNNDKGKKKT
ncbi:UNVERIFIED_CONTAM: hypothetical protein Slati_2428400 [Sesamum latifolium]|uniref:CCHC-type domain-containing protein n=1 Tax=Sesamum latifolium TaxID=2727402 RepID=A0AAW2WDQ0_9LAMI